MEARITNTHPSSMRTFKTLTLAAATVAAFIPLSLSAAAPCDFTRDLEVGVDGVGAPGKETTLFREKTKEAVIKWQTSNGLSPATGYFGPLSRAKYKEVSGATPATPATPAPPATPATGASDAVKTQLASLLAQVESLKGQASQPAVVSNKAVQDM